MQTPLEHDCRHIVAKRYLDRLLEQGLLTHEEHMEAADLLVRRYLHAA